MKKALLSLFLMVAGLLVYGQVDLANGLVAYYPFDGSAIDESGNGNDGVVYGAMLTADRCERPDRAMNFDGADDYLNCGNSPVLDISGLGSHWSVAFWLRFTDSQHTYLMYKNDSISAGWDIGVRNGEIVCRMQSTDLYQTNSFNYSTVNTFNDGGWHFIYISFNAAAAVESEAFTVSVDTVSQPIKKIAGWYRPGQNYNCTGPLLIGGHTSYRPFFVGELDDIRIYGRELSAPEIEILYAENPCCSYGPESQPNTFVRNNGKPKQEILTWQSCGGNGIMAVSNDRVSSAEVYLNGELLLGPQNFNPNVSTLSLPVTLLAGENVLSVMLRGSPGSHLAVDFQN